jgi:hypothetical protein
VYVYPFVLFLLAIVLSVLGYTDYDYSFGIFKLFLEKTEAAIKNGQSRETGKIRYTKHMTTKKCSLRNYLYKVLSKRTPENISPTLEQQKNVIAAEKLVYN